MDQSIQLPRQIGGPRPPLQAQRAWIRETPVVTFGEGPKVAFKLLLFFLLFLYSNIAVIYKGLESYRPAAAIAVAAIFMMVVEIGQSRRRFQLMWPQGILLVTFLALAFVSSFDAMWARLAFERTSDVLKILLIYILIENTVTTEKRVRTVFLTMVCCGVIPAVGLIYYFSHGIFIEGSRGAWRGLFGNPNEAAYGFLILLPLALTVALKSGWPMRIFIAVISAISLLAIFLTFSRGGMMGLLAVVGLIGWKQKSMVFRLLMVVGLIAALFVGGLYWNRNQTFKDIKDDTTFNQRIATIRAGIRMFEAHPLLGVGPGCSIVAYPLYVPPEAHCGCQLQLVIHNSFVQVLSEMGILGFAASMLLLGTSLWDAWKMQKGPMAPYATALEIALWGCIVCGLSGGFTYTWWPYILIGLVVATKHISRSTLSEGANAAAVV
jgi:O-antigen ligase